MVNMTVLTVLVQVTSTMWWGEGEGGGGSFPSRKQSVCNIMPVALITGSGLAWGQSYIHIQLYNTLMVQEILYD